MRARILYSHFSGVEDCSNCVPEAGIYSLRYSALKLAAW